MKFNFRKISAIASSVLLAGMTMGVAAAANYPSPFVSGSNADVAIVYGASSLDSVAASNIQADLAASFTGGASTVSGGESFTLDKTSDHFNFNDALNAVYSDLDDEDMTFLADGTYKDGDVDEEFTQKITLGSKTLNLFADSDYQDKAPTVGFMWSNGDTILSYEIDFDDDVNYTEMVDTDLPLFGKDYYVLAASSSQIDVLDTAQKSTIEEGKSIIIDGKTISIEFINENEVKFSVDGELTNKLSDNEYEELDDGTYIVANEVLYNSKEVGISKAVVSLGKGKLELINGQEVKINDESVDGLETTITTASTSLCDKLTFTWKSDRDTFLTESNSITMPTFEAISLSYEGLSYPDDSEKVIFDNGETLTIQMDNYDLPVMWYDGVLNLAYLGEEDNPLIVATGNIANTTWTTPNLNLTCASGTCTGGLALSEDDRFIVTRIDPDLSDCETLYYEVAQIDNDSGDITVEINDLIGEKDKTFDAIETQDVGDITMRLVAVNGTTAGKAYMNFTASSGTVKYNKVVSDKGLVITIPTTGAADAIGSGAVFTLGEADKDEDVNEGTAWTVTVKNTSNDKLHVSTHNLTAYDEEESDDNFIGIVPSDLASKFTYDTSADEYAYDVEYFGKEVSATVKVTTGGSVSTTGALGGIVVKDSEVSSVSSKNLIVVGGSCINSVAASLVGGAYCGAQFTTATGVGTGQYMVKKYAYNDKIALLVAGYEAADTTAAAQYVTSQSFDAATVDYKGTTATVI